MIKINLHLPTRPMGRFVEWSGDVGWGELGRAAEDAGFSGLSVPDHPLAPDSWLAIGGHQAFDPFVALSILGAQTSRIQLITNLIVAGYRSPYITAKAAASLDLLSDGRLVLGMGAGYVEEEFAALGADFASRGKRFDESLLAIRSAWTGTSITAPPGSDGPRYTPLPQPSQSDGPPIWIGGNSAVARRRAARLADGWMPFQQGGKQSAITGTDVLRSVDDLAERVGELNSIRAEAGRTGEFDVCFAPQGLARAEDLHGFLTSHGDACREAGVTWLTWEPNPATAADLIADLNAFRGVLTPAAEQEAVAQ